MTFVEYTGFLYLTVSVYSTYADELSSLIPVSTTIPWLTPVTSTLVPFSLSVTDPGSSVSNGSQLHLTVLFVAVSGITFGVMVSVSPM